MPSRRLGEFTLSVRILLYARSMPRKRRACLACKFPGGSRQLVETSLSSFGNVQKLDSALDVEDAALSHIHWTVDKQLRRLGVEQQVLQSVLRRLDEDEAAERAAQHDLDEEMRHQQEQDEDGLHSAQQQDHQQEQHQMIPRAGDAAMPADADVCDLNGGGWATDARRAHDGGGMHSGEARDDEGEEDGEPSAGVEEGQAARNPPNGVQLNPNNRQKERQVDPQQEGDVLQDVDGSRAELRPARHAKKRRNR
jgi:hypothetical protein